METRPESTLDTMPFEIVRAYPLQDLLVTLPRRIVRRRGFVIQTVSLNRPDGEFYYCVLFVDTRMRGGGIGS